MGFNTLVETSTFLCELVVFIWGIKQTGVSYRPTGTNLFFIILPIVGVGLNLTEKIWIRYILRD